MNAVKVANNLHIGPAKTGKPKLIEPQKKLISKDTKKTEKADPLFPPCLICGGKSSGYHFGIISCESCKIFYRRSLTRETPYQCKKNNNCDIGSGRWSSCSACRLRKCVDQGMSLGGVKRGRHSLERKSNSENMVKQIQEEEKKKNEEKEQAERQRKAEMESFVAKLLELHYKHLMVTPEKIKIVRENEEKRKRADAVVEEIAGYMEPLPLDFIREFYQATGIDLGGLKAKLQTCLAKCHEALVLKCIAYSKDLSHFMELPLTDRILLVKASMLDWYFTSKFQLLNWTDMMYTCVNCGTVFTLEEYQTMAPDFDIMEGMRPTLTLQQLNLHDEETAVLRAFVFFDTSRNDEGLIEREMISKFQDKYLECLLYVLAKHRGESGAGRAFAKISHVLTQSRSASKWKVDLVEKMLNTYKDMQLSQLVMEIFNIHSMETFCLDNDSREKIIEESNEL